MPDEWDRKNIMAILKNYEKDHPGEIGTAIREARDDLLDKKYGVADPTSRRRHVMELPAGLVSVLEESYPTLFREKAHFQWFVRNFPSLLVPEKY
jgi:hypothetical protein